MRKIYIAALLLLFSTIYINSQDKKFKAYGIAFYNLENLFDTINNNGKYDYEFSPEGSRQWNSIKYKSKQKNMAYAISQMATKITPQGPAIIGVSEIENRSVLEDLVNQETIKNWHLQIVHHDSPDKRGVDVGLLYNPRFFRVLNVTNTPLKIFGNPTFRTRDQMCVTGMLGDDKISIIVNHWPSRLGGAEKSSYLREAAAALNKHLADSLWNDDPNQGIIIMGDLNDDPMNKSVAEVIKAKRKKEDVSKHDFYNPWWDKLAKGIGTLAYKGQWNLFDQIMISDYFLGKDRKNLSYLKNEVLNKRFLMDQSGDRVGYPLRTYASGVFLNGYSDHFPVQLFLVKEVANK